MIALPPLNNCTVAVVGLGYVGLPLAVEFAKPQACRRTNDALHRRTIGFDINTKRLDELQNGFDSTNELSTEELQKACLLEFTNDPEQLAKADVFLVTVPTPIDSAKRPDLTPLKKAAATVGKALKQSHSVITPVVIFESTVYPGVTEEVCVPIIERESGLRFNDGFFCGYSPERINPGDKNHRLTNIMKVTSGSTIEAAKWIDNFYGSIISAGTHLASSLKVAEAAKVIENTQRDLNIALVNELAIIFSLMGIDTLDVLEAAGTKWNFLPFRPGLVGGHCIGVDPYYLTYKSEELGYSPQVVLSGRRINDSMGGWMAEKLVLAIANRRQSIVGAKVLVLGLTFKENCPDFRNTKVVDLIKSLQKYGMDVEVVDPWYEPNTDLYGLDATVSTTIPPNKSFGGIVVAVAHHQFTKLSCNDWSALLEDNGSILDLKGIVPRSLEPIRI